MNLSTTADEIATALQVIPGLNTAPHPPSTVTLPLAWVSLPSRLEYVATYADGDDDTAHAVSTKIAVNLFLPLVGTTRPARDALFAYLDGAGPSSIPAAIEGGTYTAADRVVVVSCELGEITYAGSNYLLASFEVEIGD